MTKNIPKCLTSIPTVNRTVGAEGLIAIENQGEGDYFLVDSQDRVYEFDSEIKEIRDAGMGLEEYIISRVDDSGVTPAAGDNGFHFTR